MKGKLFSMKNKEYYTLKIIKTYGNGCHFVTLFKSRKFVSKTRVTDKELKTYFKKGKNDIWVSKPNFLKRIERSSELINQAVAAYCLKDELKRAYMLASIAERYCEEFECSMADFVMILKAQYNAFIKQSVQEHKIHFQPGQHDIPDDLKVKNFNNLADINGGETSSIGDILKGKGVNIDEFK